jgi:hypothetical protein
VSKTNEPAYPQMHTIIPENEDNPHVHRRFNGLTKREEFAKAAMQGILANGWLIVRANIDGKLQAESTHPEDVAKQAKRHADALLAELERGSE